jgi:hypothetical protein
MYLLEDKRYAKKGDQVEVISQSLDGVCIVEAKGVRFSCRVEVLSEVEPMDTPKEQKKGSEFSLF